MTIISHPGCAFHNRRRTASRRRRFTRLRRTAEPTRLLTEKPTRVGRRATSGVSGIAASLGRRAYVRMSHWPCCRLPRRRTRWKSCDERKRESLRKRSLPVVRATRSSCSTSRDPISTSRTDHARHTKCVSRAAGAKPPSHETPRDAFRVTGCAPHRLSDAETPAALETTRLQYPAPVVRAHSLHKAVFALPRNTLRLPRSLHGVATIPFRQMFSMIIPAAPSRCQSLKAERMGACGGFSFGPCGSPSGYGSAASPHRSACSGSLMGPGHADG